MQKHRILDHALVLAFSACAFADNYPQDKLPQRKISFCGKNYLARVATKVEDRARGYMNYPAPKKHEAMLFIEEDEQFQRFWMKNVPYDLDIAFFSNNRKLVSYTTMKGTSPLMNESSLPYYFSEGPAKYAVEVQGGTLKGIKNCTLRFN